MDLAKEIAIAKNLEFFEQCLGGVAARHLFLDAIRCAEANPPLSAAGITSILCGIEGSLRYCIQETENSTELDDLDKGPNLNHPLLKKANDRGFDIETLAFPCESGSMEQLASSKPNPKNPQSYCGIVLWRNEFAHGQLFRSAFMAGDEIFSDTYTLAPAFKELITISYRFSEEVLRFRRASNAPARPLNPLAN
ncbi:hypothetical protein HAT86_04450 [Roseovarius gahaiensis]|uniref:Uncharacterized protein n=1 Tax=Roseovarius gahaiensis TaxID=2716691 RepID=A0A967B9B4_9RHOB|nr:hypothetical protein [Roseovarius gahaiensis]NHQ73717.1 hypothetical protein [Roseovarius gahaiensis]